MSLYDSCRFFCSLFGIKPKLIPGFKSNPELESLTVDFARDWGTLVRWSTHGDPDETEVAFRKEKELLERLRGEEGGKVFTYIRPYITFRETHPRLSESYGEGEWARWYMAGVLKDCPKVDQVLRK